jgi:hypothetical protein
VGSLYSFAATRVPTGVLVARDMLFFTILGVLFLFSSQKYALIGSISFLLVILAQLLMVEKFSILLIFGFKSLLPLFFLFAVPREGIIRIDEKFIIKIVRILFVLNLIFQFIHFFCGNGYYAKFSVGLNARNPGLFFFPAASAFFTLILFAVYSSYYSKLKFSDVCLVLVSVTLCASLTGMGGMCLLLLLNYRKLAWKELIILGALVLLSFVYLHFARVAMTGTTYLAETGGGRIQVFENAYATSSAMPMDFGKYTNSAANYAGGVVADSMYSALLGNLGTVWSIITAIFLGILLFVNVRSGKNINIILLVLLCSIGLNATESGISIFLAIVGRHVFSNEVNEVKIGT